MTRHMNENKSVRQMAILGGGCAGLSLAATAGDWPDVEMTVIDHPDHKNRRDHNWGCWSIGGLEQVSAMARKTWSQWAIITDKAIHKQSSGQHPYMAIESKAWLNHCRIQARQHGVRFTETRLSDMTVGDQGVQLTADISLPVFDYLADSRTPNLPDGIMLQHFRGVEIKTEYDVFDPDCAILMDFRCDQTRGIHFIYVLPYASNRALVESTMFSPELAPEAFYDTAIADYCNRILQAGKVMVLRREEGVIPMGFLSPRDHHVHAIGGNGGAIRPSSGYAFVFIQKQINHALAKFKKDGQFHVSSPHKRLDLWMDAVFLAVIRKHPRLAPHLFATIAKTLSGDEMAIFMSGQATNRLRLKIIMAMPKWPFIKALFSRPWKVIT
ncbi:MAG: lycopene cyclase family protein [Candidatus Puniceispirillales bacterium]|nr:lycopene cyclase family protein [Pseudomonadota bacterium]